MVTHGVMGIKEVFPFFLNVDNFKESLLYIPEGMKVSVVGAKPAALIDPKAAHPISLKRRQGGGMEGTCYIRTPHQVRKVRDEKSSIPSFAWPWKKI